MSNTHKKIKTDLKFVYSENNSLSVVFQDNNLLLGILGEFNKNLKELERLTKTNLYFRGNSIIIKSNPEKMRSLNMQYSFCVTNLLPMDQLKKKI